MSTGDRSLEQRTQIISHYGVEQASRKGALEQPVLFNALVADVRCPDCIARLQAETRNLGPEDPYSEAFDLFEELRGGVPAYQPFPGRPTHLGDA